MKALTFHGKQNIKYETVPDPQINNPKDVIVEINLTAICGSDLHIYHQREKGLDCGTVMGHEFVGEIIEVGKDVRMFKKGDLVVSPFTTNCGTCYFCLKGLTARCIHGKLYGWVENGCGLHGAQSEYVRVPLADSTLVKIPKDISQKEGLLLGDILCTGYFCADMANIKPQGSYAVIGCGPVGLSTIIGAKELGAEIIYAIDSVPERLAYAQQLGAIPINYAEEDPRQIIAEATKGIGVDSVLEAVGNPSAQRTAVDLVQPGGIISVVGVHTQNHFSFSPVEAYDKNLTYKTGRCSARYYIEKLIPIVQQRKYNFEKIISHELPLNYGSEAYEIFDKEKDCTKIILRP